jgi:hypothetical protein
MQVGKKQCRSVQEERRKKGGRARIDIVEDGYSLHAVDGERCSLAASFIVNG